MNALEKAMCKRLTLTQKIEALLESKDVNCSCTMETKSRIYQHDTHKFYLTCHQAGDNYEVSIRPYMGASDGLRHKISATLNKLGFEGELVEGEYAATFKNPQTEEELHATLDAALEARQEQLSKPKRSRSL